MKYEFLVEAFKCCIDENCDSCPLYDFEMAHCEKQIKQHALSFIIRQQAEIEDLKADKEALINGQLTLQKMYLESRDKAVREFAEMLTEHSSFCIAKSDGKELHETKVYTIRAKNIDELVREMTEGKSIL